MDGLRRLMTAVMLIGCAAIPFLGGAVVWALLRR